MPDALFLRPSVVAVLDGAKGEVILVSPVWHSDDVSARAAYAQAAERIGDAMRDLERPVSEARDLGQADEVAPPQSNFTKEGYMQAVEKAKDYIRAGDIFQVVPAQRWTQDFPLPPFALYRSLRRTNPSPYFVLCAAFAARDDRACVAHTTTGRGRATRDETCNWFAAATFCFVF